MTENQMQEQKQDHESMLVKLNPSKNSQNQSENIDFNDPQSVLEQVKRDKLEIKTLQDEIKLQKGENEKKVAEIEENQKKLSLLSGPLAKEFRENLSKDKFLTDYITNFDAAKAQHVQEYNQMQQLIITVLEKISKV